MVRSNQKRQQQRNRCDIFAGITGLPNGSIDSIGGASTRPAGYVPPSMGTFLAMLMAQWFCWDQHDRRRRILLARRAVHRGIGTCPIPETSNECDALKAMLEKTPRPLSEQERKRAQLNAAEVLLSGVPDVETADKPDSLKSLSDYATELESELEAETSESASELVSSRLLYN